MSRMKYRTILIAMVLALGLSLPLTANAQWRAVSNGAMLLEPISVKDCIYRIAYRSEVEPPVVETLLFSASKVGRSAFPGGQSAHLIRAEISNDDISILAYTGGVVTPASVIADIQSGVVRFGEIGAVVDLGDAGPFVSFVSNYTRTDGSETSAPLLVNRFKIEALCAAKGSGALGSRASTKSRH